MRARAGLALVLILVLALTLPFAAGAAKRKSEAELRADLQRLTSETAAAGRAFQKAYARVEDSDDRLRSLDRRLGRTRTELAAARLRLNRHAEAMYRHDESAYLEFIVGAASFEELATRFDYLQRIGVTDASAVRDVKRLEQRLLAEKAEITAERSRRAKALAPLKARRDVLLGQLKAKEARFRSVKAQLDAARGGRPQGVRSLPGPNGMVFPVVGSYYYANTWGAARSGGRHHQGTDIMARTGTPCVAVLSGTVTAKSGGLGGKTIWLKASNGWSFYYAHLDGWAVRSGHVRAGQLIGWVGSTGNAAGGSPHLHFEIHPNGGAAVNPYPYLRQME